jgi:hypothetical protein
MSMSGDQFPVRAARSDGDPDTPELDMERMTPLWHCD